MLSSYSVQSVSGLLAQSRSEPSDDKFSGSHPLSSDYLTRLETAIIKSLSSPPTLSAEDVLNLTAFALKPETHCHPNLLISILKLLLLSKEYDSAFTFSYTLFPIQRYHQQWLSTLLDNYDRLRLGCKLGAERKQQVYQATKLHLQIVSQMVYLRLFDNEKFSDVSNAISEFEEMIEALDDVLPVGDSLLEKEWALLRQEMFARLQTFKAFQIVRSMRKKGLSLNPEDVCKMRDALHLLSLSLSYTHKSVYGDVTGSFRLPESLAFAATLSSVFSRDMLLPSTASNTPNSSIFNDTCSPPGKLAFLNHTNSSFTGNEAMTMVASSAFHDLNLDGKVTSSELSSVLHLSITADPFALERILLIAPWYLSQGALRLWLRDLFPQLPEYPQEFSPSRSSKLVKTVSVIPTIADLEAYILLLLAQRHIENRIHFTCQNAYQVALLSTLGIGWKPTEMQFAFWQKVAYLYGKTSEARRTTFRDISCSDQQLAQGIQEIRGRCDFDGYAGILYTVLYLQYKEMTQAGIDRSYEERFYRGVVDVAFERNVFAEIATSKALPKRGKIVFAGSFDPFVKYLAHFGNDLPSLESMKEMERHEEMAIQKPETSRDRSSPERPASTTSSPVGPQVFGKKLVSKVEQARVGHITDYENRPASTFPAVTTRSSPQKSGRVARLEKQLTLLSTLENKLSPRPKSLFDYLEKTKSYFLDESSPSISSSFVMVNKPQHSESDAVEISKKVVSNEEVKLEEETPSLAPASALRDSELRKSQEDSVPVPDPVPDPVPLSKSAGELGLQRRLRQLALLDS